MRAQMTVDVTDLYELVDRIDNPAIKAELRRLPMRRDIAAQVAQAIADNFAKEGPGWKPLQADTIRSSVSNAVYKKIQGMDDKELAHHEAQARKSSTGEPARRILDRTGNLKKTVTTPGINHNVWKQQGNQLIWGTDLIYAGIHNTGGIIVPKNAKALHWSTRTGEHFAQKVTIPKREYLVIRDEWMKRIQEFTLTQIMNMIVSKIGVST